MPSLDSFNPSLNLGILMQGPPGAGKTTLALQFPQPYIVDCDNNLGGPARWLKSNRPDHLTLVNYETVNLLPNGNLCPPRDRYTRMTEIVKRFIESGKASLKPFTIIIDSATYVSDYIQDDIRRQNSLKDTEFRIQDWGAYLWSWKNVITFMRSIPNCTFILTCHEKPEKDDVEGIIKYFVALPGQIQPIIGGLFSDVWHFEVEENLGSHKYIIRTMPNPRYILKRSVPEMPAKLDADWKAIAKYLGV